MKYSYNNINERHNIYDYFLPLRSALVYSQNCVTKARVRNNMNEYMVYCLQLRTVTIILNKML